MKPLKELCTPRTSVFDPQKRDTVLDLTDLIDEKIDPAIFFSENYITEGMKSLLKNGFKRLEGKTEQGVYKLKQAMGGGKTHNLLTLGLLAKYPRFDPRYLRESMSSIRLLVMSRLLLSLVASLILRTEFGDRWLRRWESPITSKIATHRLQLRPEVMGKPV